MENLTLVIPAKNERESLPIVLNELKKFNIKILIVLEKNDLETINDNQIIADTAADQAQKDGEPYNVVKSIKEKILLPT